LTKALIIFIKNLIPGKVKTRLAAEVGDDAALRVYQHLLKHTKNVTQHLPVDIYVYYSDSLPGDDIWVRTPSRDVSNTAQTWASAWLMR
jgi:glycosyltransferase A (GT-A) superfamily protein (DUF2064 family)